MAIWLIETVRRTLLGTHQPLLFGEIATSLTAFVPRNDNYILLTKREGR